MPYGMHPKMAKRLSGSSGDFPQIRNRLLAALPVAEFKRLRPDLELVDLPLRKVLLAADAIITHSYFIEDGLISLVQPLSDGTAVEIGLIGHEGFVGTALLLGTNRTPAEANVQMKASAWRITAAALQDAIKKNPRLQALLLHCTSALHAQVTQTAACNSRHELGPKLARWLLSASDRAHSSELPLSHDFLAMMLSRRRSGVTVALGELKRAGLIENSPRLVKIIARPGLEKASCECYRMVRDEYKRLLP
jgi:CRP-like cAMP-binding protein